MTHSKNILNNILLITIISSLLFSFYSTAAFAQEQTAQKPYELGTILIQYEESVFTARTKEIEGNEGITVPGGLLNDDTNTYSAPVSVANSFFKEGGIANPTVTNRIESLNTEVISIGEGVDPLTTINRLKASPVEGIIFAQPNFIYHSAQSSATTGPDPRGNESWHLKAIQLKDAWDVVSTNPAQTPREITAGVIDTGTDFSNTDLDDKKWNPSSCKDEDGDTISGGCPNGGYDVHGVFHDNNPSPDGDDRHGTITALVLGGEYNNGYGGIGVSRHAKIVGIRAGEEYPDPTLTFVRKGIFNTMDLVEAIDFARENKIDIINISLGAYINPQSCNDFKYVDGDTADDSEGFLEYKALKEYGKSTQAWSGGLVVASAGNRYEQTGGGSNGIHIPSDFSSTVTVKSETNPCWTGLDNIISAGGTELQDGSEKLFEVFSSPGQRLLDDDNNPVGTSYGDHIDIVAPARDIAADRANTSAEDMVLPIGDKRQEVFHGTSFAAPQVAGVAALMLRINPSLTPAQIKTKIKDSADVLPNLASSNLAGGRRLNAYRAVVVALGGRTVQLDTLPTIPSLSSNSDYLTASKPAKPYEITSAPGNEQLTISWDKVYNAERYEIRWRAAGKKTTLTSWKNVGNVTEKTIIGLTNGIKYVVQVRGVNSVGSGDKTSVGFDKNTTPKALPPSAPLSVMSTPEDGQLTISWNSVLNAESYEIRWRAGKSTFNVWEDVGNITTKTITGLTNAIAYVVHVRAKNSAGVSGHTVIGFSRATTPKVLPPSRPTNLISIPGDERLTVSWGAVPNTSEYELRYREAGTQWPTSGGWIDIGNVTSYVITSLTNSIKYTVHVRAKNSGGTSRYRSTGFSKYTTPIPPTGGTDSDNDGLIDIVTLRQLHNMRYNLYGTSYKTGENARAVTLGCPVDGCKGYELLNDLDFAGSQFVNGVGWDSIGDNDAAFHATFEGNSHTISHLTINTSSEEFLGLFGRVGGGATISNVTFDRANITGTRPSLEEQPDRIGALAGLVYGDTITITNVVITNSELTGIGESLVGGLVGTLSKCIVRDSSVRNSTITVRGSSSTSSGVIGSSHATFDMGAGGFTGAVGEDTVVSGSSVTNTVVRTENIYVHTGGFAGNINGTVTTSSVTDGTVNNGSDRTFSFGTGGFVGLFAHGTLENIYVSGGSVTSTGSVGGIIGAVGAETTAPDSQYHSSITNIYSDTNAGNGRGIYAAIYPNATLTITSTYYNRERATAIPLQRGAKTGAQLRSGIPSANIYISWSTRIWDFGTATEYPTLR